MAKRNTLGHPKTTALARRLGVEPWAALGLLEALWHWTGRYAPAGDIGRFDDADIAAGVKWRGKPVRLIAILIETGWLDVPAHDIDARLVIHDWADHADDTTKKALKARGLAFWAGEVQNRQITREPVANDSRNTREPVANDSRNTRESLANDSPLPETRDQRPDTKPDTRDQRPERREETTSESQTGNGSVSASPASGALSQAPPGSNSLDSEIGAMAQRGLEPIPIDDAEVEAKKRRNAEQIAASREAS